MTEEVLRKGICLQADIHRLEEFVDCCKRCWKILWIYRPKRMKLVTAYGGLLDRIEVPRELSTRILQTIEQYIAEKKEEFEKLGVDVRETE